MDYPANYKIKKYKPRNLTEKQVKFCEAYIACESMSESARIAGYKSESRAANYLLQCKRIQDYINKRQSKIVYAPITFESKLDKLAHIIETTINDDPNQSKDFNTGIRAIAEANKMQGHYAAIETRNLNINADAKIESDAAKELMRALIESNKRPY